MQLFVLGPAFGLPSIDAECNAAVALLQLRVKDRYHLVSTHDTSLRLPHLVDGQARVSGFNNIVRHLANKRIADERSELDTSQRANSLAVASFIESHAQTLLDISLYVGFDNYRLTTRPAFTKILPWHMNYIVPPQRRAAARTRTEHLGISSIDVDTVHEDMSNRPPGMDGVGQEPSFEAETQKRASLLLPRKETLNSLLQRPEHAAIFKLHALADNFLGSMEDQLGGRLFLSKSERPTSVDCLLYGYLSLMLYPQLPQDWLASTMRRKYQGLIGYTKRLHALLELATPADGMGSLTTNGDSAQDVGSLPWRTLPNLPVSHTLKEIVGGIMEQLPVMGTSNQLQLLDAERFSFFGRNLHALLLSTTASFVIMGYLTIRSGFFVWPRGEEIQIFGQKQLSDYGHLGAALAGFRLLDTQSIRGG